jgi:hypothetical protein
MAVAVVVIGAGLPHLQANRRLVALHREGKPFEHPRQAAAEALAHAADDLNVCRRVRDRAGRRRHLATAWTNCVGEDLVRGGATEIVEPHDENRCSDQDDAANNGKQDHDKPASRRQNPSCGRLMSESASIICTDRRHRVPQGANGLLPLRANSSLLQLKDEPQPESG